MLRNSSHFLLGVAALTATSGAWAQSAPTGNPESPAIPTSTEGAAAPRASTAAAQSEAALDEIVVTAQRRDEPLQKTPVAVQVFSEAQLDARGATSVLDLPQMVPGLAIAPNGPFTAINLRGVGSNRPSGSVLTFIDNVYQPYTAGVTQFATVSGVEVDKGPQGTLFGRNATGGIIQITTRKPSHELAAEAEVGYANYDTPSGNFYLTGGLNETIAADLSGYYSNRREGWGVNRGTAKDVFTAEDYGVRNKWSFDFSDVTSVEFIGDYTYSRTDVGANITPLEGKGSLYNLLTRSPYTLPGSFDVLGEYGPRAVSKQGGASLKGDTEIGGIKVRDIIAWRKVNAEFSADLDAIPLDFLHAHPDISGHSISNELQLSSAHPTWLNWVAGVFYFHDSQDTAFSLGGILATPVFGAPPGSSYDVITTLTTEAIAGYGNATAELIPGTRLTLGGRYTSDRRHIEGFARFGGPGAPIVPGTPGEQEETFDKFTYRIVLDQQLTPDMLGYVSYSTGFNSGTFNELSIAGFNDVVNPAVEPETIKALEIGLKSSFFDNRLRANLSAFRYRYTNLQLQVFNFGNVTTVNAAGARIRGLDFDLTARPIRNLTVNVSGEFLDAKYTSYPLAPLYLTCPSTLTLTSGGPACDATRGNGELISLLLASTTLNGGRGADGNRAINAPKFSVNTDVGYTIPTSVGDFLTSVSVSYRDKYYPDAANAYPIENLTVINGSERWTLPNAKTYFQVWIKNATNKRYDGYVNFTTPPGVFGNPAPPRTYGVSIGHEF